LRAMTDGSPDAQLGVGFLVANFVERVSADDPLRSVRARSACRRRGARAAAVSPFSGPRSRAAVAACIGQPHQHRCALQAWGATANRACARGHHHRPDASGVACHAFAWHPDPRAGGLGHGRRHHSRWLQPAHEQTLLMARRLRTENGARERGPENVPLATCPAPLLQATLSPLRMSAVGHGPPKR